MDKENYGKTKGNYCTKNRFKININSDINIFPDENYVCNANKEANNTEINANELILIYDKDLNQYKLVKLCDAQFKEGLYVFGLDDSDQLRKIKINP